MVVSKLKLNIIKSHLTDVVLDDIIKYISVFHLDKDIFLLKSVHELLIDMYATISSNIKSLFSSSTIYKNLDTVNSLLKIKMNKISVLSEILKSIITTIEKEKINIDDTELVLSIINDSINLTFSETNDYIEHIRVVYNDIVINNFDVDVNKIKSNIYDVVEKWGQINNISNLANKYESFLQLLENSDTISIVDAINKFKDIVYTTSLNVSELDNKITNVTNLYDKLSLISFGETDSNSKDAIVNFLLSEYNIYKTGIRFIDNQIGGIESSSLYLISAPSSHGKTLLLLQLAKGLISNNLDMFSPNDVILFVTLEDNRVKISRRVYSLFGNTSFPAIRELFNISSRIANYYKQHNMNQELLNFQEYLHNIVSSLEANAIANVTHNKVKFMIQDMTEHEYNIGHLVQTINSLSTKGFTVRAVFLDYINLMTSTKRYDRAYDEQGQIVGDLRNVAKKYSIPIITATQLNRRAESYNEMLSNELMGDSYEKIRKSDYILMLRQIKDEFFNVKQGKRDIEPPNMYNILPSDNYVDVLSHQLGITEYVLSKTKDGKMPNTTYEDIEMINKFSNVSIDRGLPYIYRNRLYEHYALFSKFNLSLYDLRDVDKLINDYKENVENTKALLNIIDNMKQMIS